MKTLIDKFIRDVTSVTPRSKSEVRRRLNEILDAQLNIITAKVIDLKPVGDSDIRNGAWMIEQQEVIDILTKLK